MRKSTKVWAILLAILMVVSVFPTSVFASGSVISEVDTSELVSETTFLYSDGAAWTGTWQCYVETPQFYPTLHVNIDGSWTDVPVEWVLPEGITYDGTAVGTTYTYTAVAEGYTWECEAPTIKVTIEEGSRLTAHSRLMTMGPNGDLIPVIIKGENGGNSAWDATGYNRLYLNGTSTTFSTGYGVIGGIYPVAMSKTSAEKVVYGETTSGNTNIKVTDGATVAFVAGGNFTTEHNGNTYVTIKDAKVTGGVYGAGDSYNKGGITTKSSTVLGNAYIDISGLVTIGSVNGGGKNTTTSGYSSKVSGTTYVDIHDLTEGSSIGTISRTGVNTDFESAKFEVRLDDTSKNLLTDGKINGVTTSGYTDEHTSVYINDEYFVGVVDETTLDVPNAITKGDTLATSFGSLSGFAWEGEYEVGQQTFTLTAPEGYFFDGLAKTKEYTITVNAGVVAVEEVILDKTEVNIPEDSQVTLTATVNPENATDPTVTWTASENLAISATTGDTITVTAIAAGEGTVTATAGDVSATCVVTVEEAIEITAVDPGNELVWETVIPYDSGWLKGNGAAYDSELATEDISFYDEIPVIVNGAKQTIAVTEWTSDDYAHNVPGTYYFTAKAEGYKFAEGAQAKVTVEVVDGTIAVGGKNWLGTVAASETDFKHIIKENALYDATGCNKLADITADSATATVFVAAGAMPPVYTNKVSENYRTALTGNHSMSVIDSTYTGVVAGNTSDSLLPFNGHSYVYINGFTGKYIFGGSAMLGSKSLEETGTATLDITGKIVLDEGGGIFTLGHEHTTAAVINNTNSEGTVTLNIFDLAEDSVIPAIVRDSNNKGNGTDARTLIVNLDDTSAYLLDNVTNWTTDENIKVYINGVLQVPAVESVTLDQTELTLKEGDAAVRLTATVAPDQADQTVVWTVEGDAVTVENGLVTPVKAGTATVTATAGDVSASCVVTVKALVAYAGGIGYETFAEAVAAGGNVTLV
ncbi:MAG: Ig-like domain-containing protein, partial [Clostridia bacterium]|nr:Ig-like domain-containing protein [Clostridia bacterium]